MENVFRVVRDHQDCGSFLSFDEAGARVKELLKESGYFIAMFKDYDGINEFGRVRKTQKIGLWERCFYTKQYKLVGGFGSYRHNQLASI